MKILIIFLAIAYVTTGCSSMTVSEKETKRNKLNAMAESAITELTEQDSTIQQELDQSLGYAVANMKVTKVPIVGAGGGEGVIYNKKTQQRTYFTVSRLDLGGGWGARSYKALMVIESEEVLARVESGTWEFQAGVEASAGTVAAEGASGGSTAGFTMHILSDGGASATATIRAIRIKVDNDLTETY